MILLAGDSTIRGLIINHFDNGGILIDVDGGNVMEGNFIGTDATGMNAAANGGAGVGMTTGNNLIGGSTAGARNLISGNREGVIILASSAVGNSVQGNLIGTDVTGAVALANSGAGVRVSQAPDNIIGGVVCRGRQRDIGKYRGRTCARQPRDKKPGAGQLHRHGRDGYR